MRGGRSAGEPSDVAKTDLDAGRRADWIALALLTIIIALLFADILAGFNSLYIRDIAHAAYPARLMLRDTVLGGEFPYWNRWVSAGQPMASNPAHAVFYPLTWLILLPDYDFGFAAVLVLHILIAAWSMYALLRSLSLGPPAAFFGALSFGLGGLVLSLLDVLPLLLPLAWLPLTCLYTRRFLLHGSRRDFALAAFFFGLQALLGEVSILLQTGLLLGLYALHAGARRGGGRGIARAVGSVGLLSIAAVLVAAVQLLPAIDHAAGSVRAQGFAFERVTSWSLPAVRLAEMLHPNILGHHLFGGRRVYWAGLLYPDRGIPFIGSIYPGILLTVLAIAGVLAGVRGRRVFLWATGVSLLLALGANTPLWRMLYDAGIARAIRYPEKFIIMAIFALTVAGSVALDRVLSEDLRLLRAARVVTAGIAILFGGIAVLALTPLHAPAFIALWHPPQHILTEMLAASRSGWILVAARVSLLFLLLRNLHLVRRPVWLTLLGVLVLLDLGMLLPELAPRVSPAYFRDPPRAAQQLPADRRPFRLFHVATWQTRLAGGYFTPQPDLYWIHRNAMYPMMPATWGIRTVIEPDYDRTTLQPTAEFVDAVWEVSRKREDWLGAVGAMSNAWFAVVYVDPAEAFARAKGNRVELQPVKLIELEHAPRYYFADQVATIRHREDFAAKLGSGRFSERAAFVHDASFVPAEGVVRRVHETANSARIEVETRGRSFLVMSVTPHKYWRITIDGVEAPSIVTNVGYQGVIIPTAGTHVVGMRYRNPLFAAGGAVSLATLIALGLLARRRW